MVRPLLIHGPPMGSPAVHDSMTVPQQHSQHAELSGMYAVSHLPGCLLGRCALPGCLQSLLGALQTFRERPGLCLQPNECNEVSSWQYT